MIKFNLELITDEKYKNTNEYKLYYKLVKNFNIDVFDLKDKIRLLLTLTNFKNNQVINDEFNLLKRLKDDISAEILNFTNEKKLNILFLCHAKDMIDNRQIMIKKNVTIEDPEKDEIKKKYNIKTIEYLDINWTEKSYQYKIYTLIPHNSKDIIEFIHCPIYIDQTLFLTFIENMYYILNKNGYINIPIKEENDYISNIISIVDKTKWNIYIYNYNEDTLIFNTKGSIYQYNKSIRLNKI